MDVVLVSRIKTENGNYIAISQGEYGKYTILWVDGTMSNPKLAKLEDWLWATTWGTLVEFGEWIVEFQRYHNVDFRDYAHSDGTIECLYTTMCKDGFMENNMYSDGSPESVERYFAQKKY